MRRFYKSLPILIRYVSLSFLLTLLLLITFFVQVGMPENLVAFFYMISIPFYYYFIVLVVTLLLSPLLQIPYLKYLLVLPKIALDLFLLADLFVFRIYRFHIDMMFINMIIHDFKGIGLSTSMIMLSLIAFASVCFFNIWIFRKASKMKNFTTKHLVLGLLYLFIVGQVIHVWAYEYKQQSITKFTPYFPYYLPLTSSSMMTKLKASCPKLIPLPIEDVSLNFEEAFSGVSTRSIFNYPKEILTFNDSLSAKPNILFFLTESWRADMISEAITPNLASFSKENYHYTNHFSSGSVTVSGLFGLMYGLHPSYLSYAQSDPFKQQSLFTKSLQELGYEIGVYTPSNLDRFSLKPMLFGAIDSKKYINQRAFSSVENDQFVVDKFVEDIRKTNTTQPWFKFVFLDSSHHHYTYPEEHEKFLPIPKNSEGFVFNKNIDAVPFLNDYKNSLNYIDSLFGIIIQTLKETGLDENTIIVVTSDHAEEFNDNVEGFWGHGSNFTRYQASVPLLIKLPKNNGHQMINKRSGHVDIVPTILSQILHCNNPISDYSSGYNLFDLPDQRGMVVTSYKDKAYIFDNIVYANGLIFESYFVDAINQKNSNIDYEAINILRKEETSFLNKD